MSESKTPIKPATAAGPVPAAIGEAKRSVTYGEAAEPGEVPDEDEDDNSVKHLTETQPEMIKGTQESQLKKLSQPILEPPTRPEPGVPDARRASQNVAHSSREADPSKMTLLVQSQASSDPYGSAEPILSSQTDDVSDVLGTSHDSKSRRSDSRAGDEP